MLQYSARPNQSTQTHSNVENSGFATEKLIASFAKLHQEAIYYQDIPTASFINAYKELIKLFDYLGRALFFAKMDVTTKINHIEQIYLSHPQQFQTLVQTIEYEIRNNTHNTPDKKSATRTILRLVRALGFIIALMNEVANNNELVDAARLAYEKTLFHYHPPLVRKAVSVAVYTLPSRDTFLKRVNFQGNPNIVIARFVSDLQPIHHFLQEYYIKRNIQNVM